MVSGEQKEAKETIQSSFLIERTLVGYRVSKVDMTQGYMKDDIGYIIFLLSRVMGLPVVGQLQTWMVHFIETIKTTKILIDWAIILSDYLDE